MLPSKRVGRGRGVGGGPGSWAWDKGTEDDRVRGLGGWPRPSPATAGMPRRGTAQAAGGGGEEAHTPTQHPAAAPQQTAPFHPAARAGTGGEEIAGVRPPPANCIVATGHSQKILPGKLL